MADTVDNRGEHREADRRRREPETPKQHLIRLNRQKAYLQRQKATETEEKSCLIDTE